MSTLTAQDIWSHRQTSDNINECTSPLETSLRQVDLPFCDYEFIKESAKGTGTDGASWVVYAAL